MGETVVFFENDHHRKLANYDVLRYDIIKKISLVQLWRGACSAQQQPPVSDFLSGGLSELGWVQTRTKAVRI